MGNKAPAFQFYPKDWLEFKVLRMSDAAQGVYMRLLCHIWIGTETQYKIKNNDKFLARCLGISIPKWKKYKAEIQHSDASMFAEEKGYLVSKRLKEEHEKQELRRQQTQEASRIRWGMSDNQTNMQTDMQTECPSSSSSSPSPISSSTPKKDITESNGGKPPSKWQDKVNKGVQEIINYASSKNFSLQGSQKGNRYAASNLIKRKDGDGVPLGVERVKKLIDLAVACRGERYAPQVNDFVAMGKKWQDLLAFGEKKIQTKGRIG